MEFGKSLLPGGEQEATKERISRDLKSAITAYSASSFRNDEEGMKKAYAFLKKDVERFGNILRASGETEERKQELLRRYTQVLESQKEQADHLILLVKSEGGDLEKTLDIMLSEFTRVVESLHEEEPEGRKEGGEGEKQSPEEGTPTPERESEEEKSDTTKIYEERMRLRGLAKNGGVKKAIENLTDSDFKVLSQEEVIRLFIWELYEEDEGKKLIVENREKFNNISDDDFVKLFITWRHSEDSKSLEGLQAIMENLDTSSFKDVDHGGFFFKLVKNHLTEFALENIGYLTKLSHHGAVRKLVFDHGQEKVVIEKRDTLGVTGEYLVTTFIERWESFDDKKAEQNAFLQNLSQEGLKGFVSIVGEYINHVVDSWGRGDEDPRKKEGLQKIIRNLKTPLFKGIDPSSLFIGLLDNGLRDFAIENIGNFSSLNGDVVKRLTQEGFVEEIKENEVSFEKDALKRGDEEKQKNLKDVLQGKDANWIIKNLNKELKQFSQRDIVQKLVDGNNIEVVIKNRGLFQVTDGYIINVFIKHWENLYGSNPENGRPLFVRQDLQKKCKKIVDDYLSYTLSNVPDDMNSENLKGVQAIIETLNTALFEGVLDHSNFFLKIFNRPPFKSFAINNLEHFKDLNQGVADALKEYADEVEKNKESFQDNVTFGEGGDGGGGPVLDDEEEPTQEEEEKEEQLKSIFKAGGVDGVIKSLSRLDLDQEGAIDILIKHGHAKDVIENKDKFTEKPYIVTSLVNYWGDNKSDSLRKAFMEGFPQEKFVSLVDEYVDMFCAEGPENSLQYLQGMIEGLDTSLLGHFCCSSLFLNLFNRNDFREFAINNLEHFKDLNQGVADALKEYADEVEKNKESFQDNVTFGEGGDGGGGPVLDDEEEPTQEEEEKEEQLKSIFKAGGVDGVIKSLSRLDLDQEGAIDILIKHGHAKDVIENKDKFVEGVVDEYAVISHIVTTFIAHWKHLGTQGSEAKSLQTAFIKSFSQEEFTIIVDYYIDRTLNRSNFAGASSGDLENLQTLIIDNLNTPLFEGVNNSSLFLKLINFDLVEFAVENLEHFRKLNENVAKKLSERVKDVKKLKENKHLSRAFDKNVNFDDGQNSLETRTVGAKDDFSWLRNVDSKTDIKLFEKEGELKGSGISYFNNDIRNILSILQKSGSVITYTKGENEKISQVAVTLKKKGIKEGMPFIALHLGANEIKHLQPGSENETASLNFFVPIEEGKERKVEEFVSSLLKLLSITHLDNEELREKFIPTLARSMVEETKRDGMTLQKIIKELQSADGIHMRDGKMALVRSRFPRGQSVLREISLSGQEGPTEKSISADEEGERLKEILTAEGDNGGIEGVIKNLNTSEALSQEDIVRKLIFHGQGRAVVRNRGKFTITNEDFVNLLIDSRNRTGDPNELGGVHALVDNLDDPSFEGLDHSWLFLTLVKQGFIKVAVQKLEKFRNLNEEVARRLRRNFVEEMKTHESSFENGVVEKIAKNAVESNQGRGQSSRVETVTVNKLPPVPTKSVEESEEQKEGERLKEILTAEGDNGGIEGVIKNLNTFEALSQEDIVRKLILEHNQGKAVIENRGRFAVTNENIVNTLIEYWRYLDGQNDSKGLQDSFMKDFPQVMFNRIINGYVEHIVGRFTGKDPNSPKGLQTLVENLDTSLFQGINHSRFFLKLLRSDLAGFAVKNLEYFKDLNQEVIDELAKRKKFTKEIESNKDSFRKEGWEIPVKRLPENIKTETVKDPNDFGWLEYTDSKTKVEFFEGSGKYLEGQDIGYLEGWFKTMKEVLVSLQGSGSTIKYVKDEDGRVPKIVVQLSDRGDENRISFVKLDLDISEADRHLKIGSGIEDDLFDLMGDDPVPVDMEKSLSSILELLSIVHDGSKKVREYIIPTLAKGIIKKKQGRSMEIASLVLEADGIQVEGNEISLIKERVGRIRKKPKKPKILCKVKVPVKK